MGKREDAERRCRIVRSYLGTITDDRQRLVCFMLMRRGSDARDICKALRITKETLEAIKLQIAIDLRKAGIEIGGGKC